MEQLIKMKSDEGGTLKATVGEDGALTFDKVLDLKDKLLYLFLLAEQAKMTLLDIKVPYTLYNSEKEWLTKFKKEIKKNHLITEIRSDTFLESSELIIKIKL